MAFVYIPALLRSSCGGSEHLETEGATVRQVLHQLDLRFPGFSSRLVENESLRPEIAVAVDGRISDLGLDEPVGPDSEIVLLPAMQGG